MNPAAICYFITIILIILKLTNVISWHWIAVLSPTIAFFIIAMIVTIIKGILKYPYE